MIVSSDLPLTFFFPGEDGILPLSKDADVVSEAEQYFIARANMLPPNQKVQFLARVRKMAGEIIERIHQMRQAGSSADAIKRESETLFTQLKSTGDRFLAETEQYLQKRMDQNQSFESFDQRLNHMNLELSNFVLPPPSKSLDFGAILAAGRKAKVEENIALAGITAGVVNGASAVLVEGVNMVVEGACNQDFIMKKACEVIGDLGKDVAKLAARDIKATAQEFCGAFPGACGVIDKLTSGGNRALAYELESQFGIPREVGEQYSRDSLTVALTLLPVPPALKGLKKSVKVVPKEYIPAVRPPLVLVKGGAEAESGMCFYKLNATIQDLARKHSFDTLNPPMSLLLEKNLRELTMQIPDLDHAVMKLPHPESALAPHKALVQSITGREISQIDLHYMNGIGDKVYRVRDASNPLMVLESDPDKILKTFIGMHHFKALQLKHAEVPRPAAVGRYANEFFLAMSDVGESFSGMMERLNFNDMNPVIRLGKMQEMTVKIHDAGVAFGELHSKYAVHIPPAQPMHNEFSSFIENQIVDLKFAYEKGDIRINPDMIFQSHKETLKRYPVTIGMVQGDPHLGNITWNHATNKVGFIDLEFFTNNLTIGQQPRAFPVIEYATFLADIVEEGKKLKFRKEEILLLTNAFKRGYKSKSLGEHPDLENLVTKIYLLNLD